MFSKELQRSFNLSLKLIQWTCVLPVDYDRNTHLMSLTKSDFRKKFSLIQRYLVYIYLAFVSVRLGLQLRVGAADYVNTIPLILSASVLTICAGAQKSFIANIHDRIWLFNQIQIINGKMKPPDNTPKKERIMSLWLYFHGVLAFMLIAKFCEEADHPRYLYSIVPEQFKGGVVFWIFLILEALTISTSIHTNQPEFYTQAWVTKCMLTWHQNNDGIPTTDRQFEKQVSFYNIMSLLNKEFNICFGAYIEVIKTVMQVGAVYYLCALALDHSKLDGPMFGQMVQALVFTLTVPPALYGNCYLIYDGSLGLKHSLRIGLKNMPELDRRYFEKVLLAMRPTRVVLNGLYFLDRSMVPMFFDIIINTTVSLLLAARAQT